MGYILDSIKALFTKNTTNAASVSGARVPIMSADGTPIGNDSLANLASVLGVRSGLYLMGEMAGTSNDPVTIIQEVVAATPNISQTTCFCGVYLYGSRVMFIGYTYTNKQTGMFQIWSYNGSVKTVKINGGVYTEVL